MADVVEQTDPEQQLVVESVQVLPAGQPEVQDSAFCVVEDVSDKRKIQKTPQAYTSTYLQTFSYIEKPFLTLKYIFSYTLQPTYNFIYLAIKFESSIVY